MSRSQRLRLAKGSEPYFDNPCQGCSSRGSSAEEAVQRCRECNKYLCTDCSNRHRNSADTKHHILFDIQDTTKSAEVEDSLTETCMKHEGKILTYVCNNHDRLCCSVCVNQEHGSCKVISKIPDVSHGIAESREFKNLMARFDDLMVTVAGKEKRININRQDNEKYLSNAVTGIKKFRKQMKQFLKQLEYEVLQKIDTLSDYNIAKLDKASARCQQLKKNVRKMTSDLKENAISGKANQLFVGIKQSKSRLRELESDAMNQTDISISRYHFYPDEKVAEIKSTLSAMCSLSVRRENIANKVRYLREVDVKDDADKDDCLPVGIAVLNSGNIVVADNKNKAIKLVDLAADKVTFRLELQNYPQDLALLQQDQIAVAYGSSEIEIFAASDILTRSHVIRCRSASVHSLCYDGKCFVAICRSSKSLKVIDAQGKVLRTLYSFKEGGEWLFDDPGYVEINRECDVLYVCDKGSNAVMFLTLQGHVISVYHHDTAVGPTGMTVGSDGSVYVCCNQSGNVHQLTAAGEAVQILLDKTKELPSWPRAIACCHEQDILYVSSSCSDADIGNAVRLFQLE